jgi:hypothetical protein
MMQIPLERISDYCMVIRAQKVIVNKLEILQKINTVELHVVLIDNLIAELKQQLYEIGETNNLVKEE